MWFSQLWPRLSKTGWARDAYCLMRNDFHLGAEMPEPNLVDRMSSEAGVYRGNVHCS